MLHHRIVILCDKQIKRQEKDSKRRDAAKLWTQSWIWSRDDELKCEGVVIDFNHENDRIISRNETRIYVRMIIIYFCIMDVLLTIPSRKAMMMTQEIVE